MIVRWIAWRLIKEIFRDKRTVAFFLFAPLIVMTLIYYSLLDSKPSDLTVVARGTSRLFVGDFTNALEKEKDIRLTQNFIDDNINDEKILKEKFKELLKSNKVDGILFLSSQLIEQRSIGERGDIQLFVEGSRPTATAQLISSIAEAMDELTEAMPSMGDAICTSNCIDSINTQSIELKKEYLYTSEDFDQIDYYLPMFPAFFAFFFTFITVTIIFQRERLSGTLERLLIGPVSFFQVILGYMGGFIIFSLLQAIIILAFIFNLIDNPMTLSQYASICFVTLLSIITALLMGLFASYFSSNEFQAMQFIPLVILPQIFLSDMIWDIHDFPEIFQFLANIMPLTYANQIVRQTVLQNHSLMNSWLAVSAFIIFWIILTSVLINTHKRRN